MPVDLPRLLEFAQRAATPAAAVRDLNSACSLPALAHTCFFVFPALRHYAPLAACSASWVTLETLLHTLLGIPRGIGIDVASLSANSGADDQQQQQQQQASQIALLASLFFFRSVSTDHTFQEEFSVELPPALVAFLQSEECIAVLMRGGAVPVVAAAASSPPLGEISLNQHAHRASTSRQLDFLSNSPAPAAGPPPTAGDRSAEEDDANNDDAAAAAVEMEQLAEKVRMLLRSFSDMVDAALGTPELSASSRHRDALAAGLRAVDELAAKAAEQQKRRSEGNISMSKSTLSSSVSAELKRLMVSVIQERDLLREELSALRSSTTRL